MATAAPEIPVLARDLAFERLYRRYVQDVYHYALALLRNPADAEDVTQTTFLNAYRAFKRGEEPLKPQNWLIKIAHNAARTRYARSTRRVREVPLDEHVDSLAVPDDEKPDVREVLHALGRLPLNQRAALVMRELEGRSYAEIAETIGVSVPAVETLIFRARRSLKLNASAVRVLGVVPLPPSLAQLFDGGGLLAGGGAAVGSGFLLKAAVALVAGAVATGVVGGENSRRADAAGVTGAIATPPWSAVGALARSNPFAAKAGPRRQSVAAEKGAAAGPGIGSRGRSAIQNPRSTGGSRTESVGPSGDSPSASATPVTTVSQAARTVRPVRRAVQPRPAPLPALPSTPQLPSVPSVPLPPLPPLPALP